MIHIDKYQFYGQDIGFVVKLHWLIKQLPSIIWEEKKYMIVVVTINELLFYEVIGMSIWVFKWWLTVEIWIICKQEQQHSEVVGKL